MLALILLSLFQSDPQIEVLIADSPPHNGWPGLAQGIDQVAGVVGSSDGQWAAIVRGEDAFSFEEVQVLMRNGEELLREGQTAPWDLQTEVRVLSHFAMDADGGVVADITEIGKHVWMRADGTLWFKVLGQGWKVPGHPALSLRDFRLPHFVAPGRLSFAFEANGAKTHFDEFLFDGRRIVAQTGATGPQNLPSGRVEVWRGFQSPVLATPDGSHWMTKGYIAPWGSTTEVLALDGNGLIEEGERLPYGGFTEAVHTLSHYGLFSDGSWYATGRNFGAEENWMVRDGQLVAQSGDAILPGDARTWSTGHNALAWLARDDRGREFVSGRMIDTQGKETEVLLQAGSHVILEEGQMIDWNQNGLEDDHFVFASAPGEPVIDRAGRLVLICRVKNTLTGFHYSAVLRLTLDAPVLAFQNLLAGQLANLRLSQAEPAATAYLLWSRQASGRTFATPFGPIWLQLGTASISAPLTVDASGNASVSAGVPPQAAGWLIAAQGVVIDSSGLTVTAPIVQVVP